MTRQERHSELTEFIHLLSIPSWAINSHLSNKNEEKEKQRQVVKKSTRALLTLEDVCPVWSKKIRHPFDETDKSIMSSDSKYCLVGEAWGFSGRHAGYYIAPLIPFFGCWTCVMFGHTMGRLSRKRESQSRDLDPIIADFLKHWNEKHKNITEKLNHGRKKRIIFYRCYYDKLRKNLIGMKRAVYKIVLNNV
ncbi:MAG TPA: hypothetical protein VFI73_02325 [Candidatus Nitrosopolaris sp.]|nr:hypothetical protein [Candidatus Nitrosopolaris sp.]